MSEVGHGIVTTSPGIEITNADNVGLSMGSENLAKLVIQMHMTSNDINCNINTLIWCCQKMSRWIDNGNLKGGSIGLFDMSSVIGTSIKCHQITLTLKISNCN